MEHIINLELKQKQQLILTNELRQSIEMLQFNKQELMEYINQQVLENPVLEKSESSDFESIEDNTDDYEKDMEYLEYLESFDYKDNYIGVSSKDERDYSFLNFTSVESNLYDDLLEQLYSRRLSKIEYRIGEDIIQNIDERGYFIDTTVAIANRIGCSVALVEEMLIYVQSFEPQGIGARNLVECLLNQVEMNHDIARIILEFHIEDLANNRLPKISKELGISLEKVISEFEYIKSLNPKPASVYNDEKNVKYIFPDAKIEKSYDSYVGYLIDDDIPSISISNAYLKLAKNGNKDAKEYITSKYSQAKWLIDSISQRQNTILKVVKAIADIQTDFFEKGIQYLVPMNQKDLADVLNVHESTISRATTNKYVETPSGTFELKFFFSTNLVKQDGKNISNKSVKDMIREMIDKEDRIKPLSDEKLRILLLENGYDISRRTVAKYREELGILKSNLRKKY